MKTAEQRKIEKLERLLYYYKQLAPHLNTTEYKILRELESELAVLDKEIEQSDDG